LSPGGHEKIFSGCNVREKVFFYCCRIDYGGMVQATGSGKQNIAKASMASATSKETEIKLTNIARASLEKLQIGCADFLASGIFECF
jgi:hypothetical protein